MSQRDKVTFDFGQLSGDDVKRVMQEIKERQYGHFEIDDVAMKAMPQVANMFVRFVKDVLTHMGLIDKVGIASPRFDVTIGVDPEENPEEGLKALWNERAKDWAVVESAPTYGVTFQTLIEHFHTRGPSHKETIVSLGSGPGLYETFLGGLTRLTGETSDLRIICVDSAKGMTECHRQILKDAYLNAPGTKTVLRIKNVEAITGDMLKLKFADGSIDQIICNNSLQWTLDWRKAIAEMARIINPKGLGYLYLFVHRHPMTVYKADGTPLVRFGEFSTEDLFDCLEENRFQIEHMRQIAGARGTGQMGQSVDRVFVRARFMAGGITRKWRDASVSAALSAMR